MDLILRPADTTRRLFFDTEFYEDGATIDLISIGMVDEYGAEFYAVNREARLDRVSDWVRTNVLPQLPPYGDDAWMTRAQIRDALTDFVRAGAGRDLRREFWAYYADYDWVVLCQLYGTMMQLPEGFPKFAMDLKQLSVHRGSPPHPRQTEGVHNALADARWNRELFRALTTEPVKSHLDEELY